MRNIKFLLTVAIALTAMTAGFTVFADVDFCLAEGGMAVSEDLPTGMIPGVIEIRLMAGEGAGIGSPHAGAEVQFQAVSGRLGIALGYESVRWGAGRYDTLILDDRAQSYPFILLNSTAQTKFGRVEYSKLTGKLGPYPDTYLLGQRLDLYPRPWLRFGISEVAIADGRFASMVTNWIPLWPFYLTQHIAIHSGVPEINESSNENLGLDATIVLRPGTTVYGEFFVDDMPQNPKNGGVYQIGFLVGGTTELNKDLRLDAEYARANNYTYTFRNPARSYLNQGEPLGFQLGPDADRLIIMLRKQSEKIETRAGVELRRRGEGRIGDKWQDIGWQKARKYSFLYGVVEQTSLARAEVDRAFGPESRIKSGIAIGPVRNKDNVPGATDMRMEWTLGLELKL
ncbi:MAG: hypothetical protein HPY52_04220 [Firmicutes bacterium]|nr:hypothetical protein [Bacillota bacterium]